MVLNDGLEHLLSLFNHAGKMVGVAFFLIGFGELLALLWMFDEILDAFAERLGTAMAEDATRGKGERTRRGKLRVRNDGHCAAGDGLNSGDPFDFKVACMDVDVGVTKDVAELLLVAELDDDVVGEPLFLRELPKVLFPRALAAEDDLDALVVLAACDGLDDEVLPLFRGEAARHRDDDLIRVFLGLFRFDAVEIGNDAVADDMEFVVAVIVVN